MSLRKNEHDLFDFQEYSIKTVKNEQNFVKFLHIYRARSLKSINKRKIK